MFRPEIEAEVVSLWRRFRDGDESAVEDCEIRFGTVIGCIVRRVLRRRRASSALERYVLSLADSEGQSWFSDSLAAGEDLATRMTRRICQAMVAELGPSRGHETVEGRTLPTIALT